MDDQIPHNATMSEWSIEWSELVLPLISLILRIRVVEQISIEMETKMWPTKMAHWAHLGWWTQWWRRPRSSRLVGTARVLQEGQI